MTHERYRISTRDKQFYKEQFEKEWIEYYWNEFVLKYEDKIIWTELSRNPNITIEFIKSNPDKPWDWESISCNKNITWEFIEAYPDKPWDWDYLSKNINITWDIVSSNPNKPWKWEYLSKNKNITCDIIQTNPNKPWYWEWLSNNLFTKEKERFMESKHLEHIASFRIQCRWRRSNEDPRYELCRKRINREYEALFEK